MNKVEVLVKYMVFLIMFATLTSISFASNEIIDFSLDKNYYYSGENISVTGALYSLAGEIQNATLTISINGTLYNTTTDSTGKFTKTIIAPSKGDHVLIVMYGSATSQNKTLKVTSIDRIKLSIISSNIGSYHVLKLSSNKSKVGITANGSITGTLRYANFTYNGTTFFVIIQKETGDEKYENLFISPSPDFSSIDYQYISENSRIFLNNAEFTAFYIDPKGTKAILAQEIEPVFFGTGSETARLLIVALDANNSIDSGSDILSLKHVGAFGVHENITDGVTSPATITLSQKYNGITNFGIKVQSINVGQTGGSHHLIVGGFQTFSYFVKKFKMKLSVETLEGNLVSTASDGQTINLKASLVDINNGTPLTGATVTAYLVTPDGTENTLALTSKGSGLYEQNHTLSTATGEVLVKFKAAYSGDVIFQEYRFKVKNYDMFIKAFSKERGEDEGFAPNTTGFLIVGGRNISSSEFLNLSRLTSGCNSTQIKLLSIQNEKEENKLSVFSTKTLTDLLNNESAPSYIFDEMYKNFGEDACAITFKTPLKTGSYNLALQTNMAGTLLNSKTKIDVTSLFVHGVPVNCNTGSWQDSVTPGSKVCLRISAYDAKTGKELSFQNITDVNIIEVYSFNKNQIITDQISNINVTNLKGNTILSFTSSNKSIGGFDVKFRVKAETSIGTSKSSGHSYYRTELWNAWSYVQCDGWTCSFGLQSNITIRTEAFSAGRSGPQEGLTVSVVNVRNWETGEVIQVDSGQGISCVTESDNSSEGQTANTTVGVTKIQPAICSLTIPAPPGGWDSGEYEIQLKVKDSDDIFVSTYSWFKVESFMFWAWSKNGDMTSGQDAKFDISVKDFDGTSLAANVTPIKLFYRGNEYFWTEKEIEGFSADTVPINGDGVYILNKSAFSGLKSGEYEIIFQADSEGKRQTTRAWFRLRPFVVYVEAPNNNWEHSYEINGNLTINITAFETINWMTWPPTGDPHNITNATIKRIEKDGMWDKAYKQSGKDTLNETVICTLNNCLLTVSLGGFEQSNYHAIIEIMDEVGNTVEGFYWFKTETFKITVPEIQDWRTVLSSNKLTETMELKLNSYISCGTKSDSIIEPANVTNCIADSEVRLPTIHDEWDWNNKKATVFLLDKSNYSNPKLYINVWNNTWVGNLETHYNFTKAVTQKHLGIGDNFTDTNGYEWQIQTIDAGLGKIKLKSNIGVIRSRTKQADNSGEETKVEYMNLYIVNKSMSESGIFLYAGNGDGEDRFWDDQWANIDLDADGKYNCQHNNISQEWECEEYFMLLSDSETAGKYDTLILSATRNMTQGVDSNTGFNATSDIRLNSSADPIFLLNLIYSENNGIGKYRMVTTTNTAGWPGRNLGVFQVGSESVKIPVMISQPSTGQGLAGKEIVIRKLRTFGKMDFKETQLSNPSIATTMSNGIALVDMNLSGIPSGEYIVIIEVNESGEMITTANDWDNPRLELRSFEISNMLGIKSIISGIVEWSVENNNLFKFESREEFLGDSGKTKLRLHCGEWNNEINLPTICHVDDWMYRQLWVNLTDPANVTLIIDSTPNDWYLYNMDINTTISINGDVIINDEFGGQINYIFENASIEINKITLSVGQSIKIPQPGSSCSFNITLIGSSQAGAFAWDVKEVCPWGSVWDVETGFNHTIGEKEFLWGMFNLSSSTDFNATFNIFKRTAILQFPVSGLASRLEDESDMRVRVVTNIDGSGYDLYVFNDNDTKTSDDLEGRSGMFDRVAVVNSSHDIVADYGFGQPIYELGNKSVVKANPWDRYVYLSNLSFGGKMIYPLPWSCDNEKYYVGTFTELDLGFKIEECYEVQQQPLTSAQNYVLLFDSVCDGDWQVTNAMIDDDPVFGDRWMCSGGSECLPYDYDAFEKGNEETCNGNHQARNYSEKWIELGREGWPFSISDYSDVNITGEIDIFKGKNWGVDSWDNITALTLWVQAKNFDGTKTDGNISLETATGMSWSCGFMQEIDFNISTSGGNLTDGLGYLDVDFSQVTSSQTNLKFKVSDLMGNVEYISKNDFWYGPADMKQNEQSVCEGFYKESMPSAGSGGGSSGGFEDFAWIQQEFDKCMQNNESISCGDAECAWFDTTQAPAEAMDEIEFVLGLNYSENICVPCPVFDGDEQSCLAHNNSCIWIPTYDFEIGLCDPISAYDECMQYSQTDCTGICAWDTEFMECVLQ